MKVKNLVMFLVLAVSLLLVTGCGTNMLEFAADEDSTEACEYKASKDLDDGEWQEVIDSDCAGPMQKGAAYFGRAGYDISDIIERMSGANDDEDDNDVETYVNDLVGTVSQSTLDDLYSAVDQYDNLVDGDEGYDDAQFYINLFINPVLSLSSIKGIIDSSGNGIDFACDKNDNGTPDEVDVASCALVYEAVGNCNVLDATGTPTPDLDFSSYGFGTYTGMTVVIDDNGGEDSGCAVNDTYYRLLKNTSPKAAVVTTSDDCPVNSVDWKCPYEDASGDPVDVVEVFDTALTSAAGLLETLLGITGESDLDEAITDLRDEACGGDTCTSQEISTYIQNLESE